MSHVLCQYFPFISLLVLTVTISDDQNIIDYMYSTSAFLPSRISRSFSLRVSHFLYQTIFKLNIFIPGVNSFLLYVFRSNQTLDRFFLLLKKYFYNLSNKIKHVLLSYESAVAKPINFCGPRRKGAKKDSFFDVGLSFVS